MENNNPIKERKTFSESLGSWWPSIQSWFRDLFDLEEGLDREGTVIAIKGSKKMRGSNAWLLICSIMIASLGLDLNSGAVIIGAMLISPLMAPILGVGLSVAINDREALWISLQHFLLAIVIALITSTFYFWITPLGDMTPQIRARTEPNLLDGLVAIFGGLAGIISTSRKDKGSAIPGVAIATALMPPLCVTGFGLANGDWTVALNSFYLFFLNSFFIAMTAFLIIRLLNFEMHTYEDRKEARKTRAILVFFSLLLILPSIYILMKVYDKRQTENQIQTFIELYINQDPTKRKYFDHDYEVGDTINQLILEVFGEDIPQDSIPILNKKLEELGLKNTKLSIIQESDIDLEKVRSMDSRLDDLNGVVTQLEKSEKEKEEQSQMIENLAKTVDSLQFKEVPFNAICNEAKALFPELRNIGFGGIRQSDFDNKPQVNPIWLVNWSPNRKTYLTNRDEKKLRDFLKVRSKLDTVILIRY